MEKVFIDTSFIIALARSADENHEKAKYIGSSSNDRFFLTDHIIDELVTYLVKKQEVSTAYEIAKRLLYSNNVEVLFAHKERLDESIELLNNYKKLSLCDALSVVSMREHNIKKIISFDTDFDEVPEIERVY